MSFGDSIFSKLFGGKDPETVEVTEPLKRSDQFLQEYETWRSEFGEPRLIPFLKAEYRSRSLPGLIWIEQTHMRGLYLKPSDHLSAKDLSFALDLLAERMIDLGYRKYTADITSRSKGDKVERTCRRYLKPPIDLEPPRDQLYGNILLELVSKNEEIKGLRFTSTIYTDRSYKDGLPFAELIQKL